MSDRPFRRRLRNAGAWSALLTGAGLGFTHAFPIEDVRAAGKCPPAGEGLNYCIVQKAWLPAVMSILLTAAACFFIYEAVLRAPGLWRAFRAEQARRKAAAAPPWETDTTLLAASWGNKYDDPQHPKPRRVIEGPIAVPAQPAPAQSEPEREDPERQRRVARIALALDLAEQLGLEPKPFSQQRAA